VPDESAGPKRAGLVSDRKGRRVLVERFGEKKRDDAPERGKRRFGDKRFGDKRFGGGPSKSRGGGHKRGRPDRARGPRPSRPRPPKED
jgi:hypothetical protein